MKQVFVVQTTAPDVKSARRLARLIVRRRLAACVTFRGGFESVYRWKGKIENSPETVLTMKTSKARLAALEKTVRANHPYQVPEFLAVKVAAGSKDYLHWIEKSLR